MTLKFLAHMIQIKTWACSYAQEQKIRAMLLQALYGFVSISWSSLCNSLSVYQCLFHNYYCYYIYKCYHATYFNFYVALACVFSL